MSHEYVVERILGSKVVHGKKEYHIKWEGYEEITWEPASMIMEDIPELVVKYEQQQEQRMRRGVTLKQGKETPKVSASPAKKKRRIEATNDGNKELVVEKVRKWGRKMIEQYGSALTQSQLYDNLAKKFYPSKYASLVLGNELHSILTDTAKDLLLSLGTVTSPSRKREEPVVSSEPVEPLQMPIRIFVVSVDPTGSPEVRFVEERTELSHRMRRALGIRCTARFARVHFVAQTSFRLEDCTFAIDEIFRKGFTDPERRGCLYTPLAVTDSQLRKARAWFVSYKGECDAVASNNISEGILSQMGEFKSIVPMAKRCARVGMLFSTSYPVLNLKKEELMEIDDITHQNCVFSDGCGLISECLMREACTVLKEKHKQNLGQDPEDSLPSVLQVRVGGVKGVLVCSKNIRRGVYFRPSMKKFESPHRVLEVVNWSRASCSRSKLNQQLILLFEACGVKKEKFLELQKSKLEDLTSVFSDSKKAFKVLKNRSGAESFDVPLRMLLSGFDPMKEPYLRHILRDTVKLQLPSLRARVPVEESAIVFGIVDTKNILREGQVYICLSRWNHVPRYVVNGKVAVSRNPAYHPGDLRVLDAVNCDTLYDLKDVIIFSAQGSRPESDRISGGDLDGDTFFVTWNPELVPTDLFMAQNYQYSDEKSSSAPSAIKTSESIDEVRSIGLVDGISRVFKDFLRNNIAGLVDTFYNICAARTDVDIKRPGHTAVCSSECFSLARLFSTAIDAAKSGASVCIPSGYFNMKTYPDYMAYDSDFKPIAGRKHFETRNAMGLLFRNTMNFMLREWKSLEEKLGKLNNELDQDLLCAGYEKYEEFARAALRQYRRDAAEYMRQQKTDGVEKDVRRPYRTVFDSTRETFSTITVAHRNKYDEEVERARRAGDSFPRLKIASAYYSVTYKDGSDSARDFRPSLTFPWLVCWPELLQMKSDSVRTRDEYGFDDDGCDARVLPYVIAPMVFQKIFK